MIACFDFYRRLPTYDYFPWLWHVKLLGATEITFSMGPKLFMRHKWPREETEKRFEHYIKPGTTGLSGLPWRMGEDGNRTIGSHLYRDILRDITALPMPVRLVPRFNISPKVKPLADARYTVTIRRSRHKPERNSDGEMWREFARRINAFVFEEHDEHPVPFMARMATYAQAKMNFGIPNGPLFILYLTSAPLCMLSDPVTTAKDWKRQDMQVGEQVPWALPWQRIVWERQSMDALMDAFEWAVKRNDSDSSVRHGVSALNV